MSQPRSRPRRHPSTAARYLPHLIAFTVVVAGASACASGGPAVPQLHPWEPPTGQPCEAGRDPGPPTALVDTTAVRAVIRNLDLPDGGVVISFHSDTTGALEDVLLTQTTLPTPEARAIRDSIDAIARRGAGPVGADDAAEGAGGDAGEDEAWSGRLLIRVAEGAVTELTAGPSLVCRPFLRNQAEASNALQRVYERTRKTGTAAARFYIDTTGVPTRVWLSEGSGDAALDRELLAVGRILRFHPAYLNERVRPLWARLNLTVQESCPARRESPRWRTLPRSSPCWDRAYAPSPG